MESSLVNVSLFAPIATLTLNDPERRNALGLPMFDAIDAALAAVAHHESSFVLHLRGAGPAFCAGFDLAACVAERDGADGRLAEFVRRLSSLLRALRRARQIVVAEVQGAALAGGCAVLSACDFVCVAPNAMLGYPVHRIGVSPAVSFPTLRAAAGGAARGVALSGEIVDGARAVELGLATRCAPTASDLPAVAEELCRSLATKGRRALLATKGWVNELDGSECDAAFEATAEASASLCGAEENRRLLHAFWEGRKQVTR